MQIVIDIPEQIYKELTETAIIVTEVYPSTIERALTEGIVLPKGHGRLKDVDALKISYGLECATKYGNESKEQQANSYDTMMMYEIADMLDYAPTIIDADEVESEK